MLGDAIDLTHLMLETPIGGIIIVLVLLVLTLLFGVIPTPREFRSQAERIRELEIKVVEKEAESHEAHNRLDQVTSILLPTLQSIERRLDGIAPAERHTRSGWLPWERGK